MISFKDKINNLLDRGLQNRTRFLTLSEQAMIKNMIKKGYPIILDGGYNEAERKRALFYTEDNMIKCYKLEHRNNYLELTHQNVLGTLLSLNIERNTIGDILPKQGIFFVTEEISYEIINSFTMINQVPVKLVEYNNDVISEQEYTYHTVTCTSLRLDSIISKLSNTSRNNALDMLKKEYIKVNHVIQTKATKQVFENDVISIRKQGRFELLDCSKTSKKGKMIVNYRKFK